MITLNLEKQDVSHACMTALNMFKWFRPLYIDMYRAVIEDGFSNPRGKFSYQEELNNGNPDLLRAELIIYHCFMKAARQGFLTYDGLPIHFKMDSYLARYNHYYEMCVEALQMLARVEEENQEKGMSFDKLRVYPAIVNKAKLKGTQAIYTKYSAEIKNIVQEWFQKANLLLPPTSTNYDCLDPQHVEGWLEAICTLNNLDNALLLKSIREHTRLSYIDSFLLQQWVNQVMLAETKQHLDNLLCQVRRQRLTVTVPVRV